MTTLPVISFAKLEAGMPMPHLLDIQTRSFQALLASGEAAAAQDLSLERVFQDTPAPQDVQRCVTRDRPTRAA